MGHLTEDDLVLYRYQESPDAAVVERHLAVCQQCRAEYAAIERVLGLMETAVPEPPPSYERDVWIRVERRLAENRPSDRLPWWRLGLVPQFALATLIVALIAGSYTIDRLVHPPGPAPGVVARAPAEPDLRGARDRVLLGAVGEHLQRAEVMLIELNNVDGDIDLTSQQEWADDLISENRLYRQSAASVGETQMASLLDDLERVLLEVKHAPSSATAADLERLRTRLDTREVLFKVRVAGADVRARTDVAAVVGAPFKETGSGL
jgi:hypothetical protein